MKGYVSIFLRGLAIVCLVSWNTTLLAQGRSLAIVVAAALSGVWWLNARTASRADGPVAMVCYATGAGCGTALGLWLSTVV